MPYFTDTLKAAAEIIERDAAHNAVTMSVSYEYLESAKLIAEHYLASHGVEKPVSAGANPEMVERVANVILKKRQEFGYSGKAKWESEPDNIKILYRETAKAVLDFVINGKFEGDICERCGRSDGLKPYHYTLSNREKRSAILCCCKAKGLPALQQLAPQTVAEATHTPPIAGAEVSAESIIAKLKNIINTLSTKE